MENKKMNPEVKEKWLIALKSGEYNKGVMGLRKDVNGKKYHCCLGVLCELYIKETGDGVWNSNKPNEFDVFVASDGVTSNFPTASVQKWAGIEFNGKFTSEPGEFIDDRFISLVFLNDSLDTRIKRNDFSIVIQAIEKYF